MFSWVHLGTKVHKVIKSMKIEPLYEFLWKYEIRIQFSCIQKYLCKSDSPDCVSKTIKRWWPKSNSHYTRNNHYKGSWYPTFSRQTYLELEQKLLRDFMHYKCAAEYELTFLKYQYILHRSYLESKLAAVVIHSARVHKTKNISYNLWT